ncbi:ABC-F type ribosomal protection protein [Periweissella cryptocerci]|uniref:ABC-F type ribosomal protection protein n=1 Tax=Periweissella cryptocerci TaxID=2506420 RepID=A0A4P6YTW1_9LACO|nr:ABC-F type ribosomal protection protein [Periweissella cryptocerci]QBO36209.1 ABC-F type ribosomal protection protein [Periweissella cryptocerci]
MGTIQIQNLSFRYDNQLTPLFDHVDLQFDASWHLGLIGRNGRGKTTLLNILRGKLEYHGHIVTDLNFQYYPQPIDDMTQNTWNVIRSITSLEEYDQWKILVEFSKLELPEDILERPFTTLSPGQQAKVLLASLFIDEGNFQLIDEPTNHLDIQGREVVAQYLQQKSGFIVISHDRVFLDRVIDHVLSIDRAKISLYKGNYSTWHREKYARDDFERLENEKLKDEISRLSKTAREKSVWSGFRESMKNSAKDSGFVSHKAAKMMKRSKVIEARSNKAITEKEKLLKNLDEVTELTMNYEPLAPKQILVSVDDVQVKRNGVVINQPVSFTIKTGERVALNGMNGAGKTTLLHALFHDRTVTASGKLELQPQLKISYLAQDLSDLHGTLDDYAATQAVGYDELVNVLRKLGFERDIFESNIENMSMGQIRKIALAASLLKPANLYIWDEPLNYLDVLTREQLEDLIIEYKPTMLFIEHDQAFVEHVATQQVNLIKQN